MEYKTTPKLKSLDDYLAIGFDADLCLIKYNLREFIWTLFEALAKSLTTLYNYPIELLKFNPETDYHYVMNNLILDLQNGNVLKVSKHKQVLRAMHGFAPLTEEQIVNVYGREKKFNFEVMASRVPGKYIICGSYFEIEIPLMFMRLVEIKEQNIKYVNKTYNDLHQEIRQGLLDNFLHYNHESYKPIQDFGNYYPAVLSQKDKLFIKQTRMRKILETLRAKGKFLFINSNSHYEYLNEMFEYEFGKDWLSLFDAVIAVGMKPSFFTNKDKKFKEIDELAPNRMGSELLEPIPNKFVAEGNSELLHDYFRKLANRDGRMLFFGDNYISDCLASQINSHTDAVCIMEEQAGSSLVSKDCKWGDYFKDTLDGKEEENYFVSLMKENVAFVASSCDDSALDSFYGL